MKGYLSVIAMAAIACGSARAAEPAESRIAVRGVTAPVEILIDRWGVPHIYGSTARDTFFAQGWNVARDRLWQIDLWRRTGLGELSAVLGTKYVAQDRAIRLFRFRGDMKKEWAFYGKQAKSDTEAFVAGINAYVGAIRDGTLPVPSDFRLAGYLPAYWTADDVVRVRNHGLAGSVVSQLTRAKVLCKTGSLEASELLIEISPSWAPIIPEGLDMCSIPGNVLEVYQLARASVQFGPGEAVSSASTEPDCRAVTSADLTACSQGSNNWVVAPARTATGRPILANDPHRALAMPSLRYISHLVAPGLDVVGAGEPALPGISIGHNQDIAFGLTIFPIAQEDLYVYDTDPKNSDRYRYRGRWEKMRTVRETIAVRDGRSETVELKFTRHGPVVMEDPGKHRAYAVRAAWLDVGGAPYFGAMNYLRSRNLAQFGSALDRWGTPGENQVYADRTGRIGWFPVGFTPVRPNSDGLLPLPGDGRYEWRGYLSRDKLPSETDPDRGYIATANNMPLPTDYPYQERRIGFMWQDSFRADRIKDVLEKTPKTTVQQSQLLQNDYFSLPADRLLRILSGIVIRDPELKDHAEWLGRWDRKVTANSPQAAFYELWASRYLVAALMEKVAPDVVDDMRSRIGGTVPAAVIAFLEKPDRRLGADFAKARDELMVTTLSAALAEAKSRLGEDRSQWQWGRLATIRFEHPLAPLASAPYRSQLNIAPVAKSGDGSVVGLAAYRPKDFQVWGGASFRMVLDVGEWDNSVAINTPGQSGDPGSPHYKDLFSMWLQGETFPMLYSRERIEQAVTARIVLEPSPEQGRNARSH